MGQFCFVFFPYFKLSEILLWNFNRLGKNSSGVSGLAIFMARPGEVVTNSSSLLTLPCLLCFPDDWSENISLLISLFRQWHFNVFMLPIWIGIFLLLYLKWFQGSWDNCFCYISTGDAKVDRCWLNDHRLCLRPSFLTVGWPTVIMHWVSKINLKSWPLKGQRRNEF